MNLPAIKKASEDMENNLMQRAVRSGHTALIDLVMRCSASVHDTAHGYTPLHKAAELGLRTAVESLLSYGARPDVRDYLGETPLHKAARLGHVSVVEALLPYVDPNVQSAEGITPLHWACLVGHSDVVELLLDAGADPFIPCPRADDLNALELAEVMEHRAAAEVIWAKKNDI
jgi:ankyrin repeat protein